PGDWSIFARTNDGAVGIGRATLGMADTSATVPLGKGGRITGRVVAENGSPLPDLPFDVEAIPDLSSPIGFVAPLSGGATARVKGSAPFELTELLGPRQIRVRPGTPAGWFVAAVVHNGRNIVDEVIDFKGGETLTGVQIVVSDRGGSVHGSAVDAAGRPLADYFVMIVPEEAGPLARLRRLARAGRSNQKGAFTFETLAPGRYLAAILDDVSDADRPTFELVERLRPRATPFSVVAGEAVTVTLRPAP